VKKSEKVLKKVFSTFTDIVVVNIPRQITSAAFNSLSAIV